MIPPSVPFWYPPWYTDHLHGQIPRRAERWADSAVSTLFHEFRILSSSSLSIYLLSCVSSRKRGLISDDDDDSRCLLISNRSINDRSMDRWFFTRFSLVAKKVTLRVVDPWRARDRIVKLLRALRDFILFRFILFPFFLSLFSSPPHRDTGNRGNGHDRSQTQESFPCRKRARFIDLVIQTRANQR